MPVGYQLGGVLLKNNNAIVLVLVGMVIGYFVVAAEPAVFVLKRQVAEVTSGAISEKAMGIGLSVGVAMSVGLAMLRVITGISFYILLFQVIYLPLCLHLLCLIFLHQLHLILELWLLDHWQLPLCFH